MERKTNKDSGWVFTSKLQKLDTKDTVDFSEIPEAQKQAIQRKWFEKSLQSIGLKLKK